MNRTFPQWAGAAVVMATAVGGCAKVAPSQDGPAFTPKKYTFAGKVDPKFVGLWVSSDGHSKMTLLKDGSLAIATVVNSVAGKGVSTVKGAWLVNQSSLMFKYAIGKQPTTVLKYGATLNGKVLRLMPAGSHKPEIYHRA